MKRTLSARKACVFLGRRSQGSQALPTRAQKQRRAAKDSTSGTDKRCSYVKVATTTASEVDVVFLSSIARSAR